MAMMMQVYTALRLEAKRNPKHRVDPHRCLVQYVGAKTIVVRLHYSQWNPQTPPSTSINGVLVRCYFNYKQPHSNYIIAYSETSKAINKRTLLEFLEQYPLRDFQDDQPTTVTQFQHA